ncbi:MAG: flagellar biosynthesis protein FliQ, partial [Acidimicrobiaceae bacterium]|nr:flagellar biosynthesis protein FliQ [Acidimicrobiaceae bacterium]
IQIALHMMTVTAKVSAPILLTSLALGLAISLFQSVTQIQEVTLTFVPKLAGVALVIIVSGHWMLAQIVGFTHELFNMLPQLLSS